MQRVFLWLVVGLSLSACASVDRPSVTLASVKLAGVGLLEQRLVTTLRIQNPSSVDLALQGVSVEIELNGNTFSRGVNPASIVIPAYTQDTSASRQSAPHQEWSASSALLARPV